MRFGNLLFDPKFRYASRTDGKTIQFTPVETAALALLTAHVGQILPRQRLLDATQRGEAEALERSVDLLINRLRGKLGDSARAPRFIATSYGEGYSWIAAPEAGPGGDVYVAIGPAAGPEALRAEPRVRAFLTELADALRARLPSERGVSLLSLAAANEAKAPFRVEVGLRQDEAGVHCAVVLREAASGAALRAERWTIAPTDEAEVGHTAAAAFAASLKSEIWRSLARARGDVAGPTDEPIELRLHRAAVLLARTPQSWLESEIELQKLRAEQPDDPQTALMWASHLYARLVLDLTSDPAELEPQIEALVFQALPHVRDNPMLALAAAKLLCFVSHGHLELAEALAEEAFAQSTAFASAFAVLGQLRLNRGRLQEAIDYFDQGIELAEAGSEFQVFLMVLKCTTLLALDDRQACLAACEALYRTKPLTRAQMGLFLSSPDEVLPDDLRQILLGLDADLLRRLLAHFEYLFVRRVPDAAARKNMFRGVLAQLARHRPLDGLPARVSAYL
ncbi:helix-turn-helix domain-containing protein [Achromobacter dolens]|uniref:winged helix-turn-helix domain-containing protein n=1 Tax=Achromobacter dolens TaxID=1287738 RepID=UPI0031D52587